MSLKDLRIGTVVALYRQAFVSVHVLRIGFLELLFYLQLLLLIFFLPPSPSLLPRYHNTKFHKIRHSKITNASAI